MIALYEKGGKIIGSNPRYYIRFAITSAVRWSCLHEDVQADSLSVGGIGGLQLMTDAAVKSSVMMTVFI